QCPWLLGNNPLVIALLKIEVAELVILSDLADQTSPAQFLCLQFAMIQKLLLQALTAMTWINPATLKISHTRTWRERHQTGKCYWYFIPVREEPVAVEVPILQKRECRIHGIKADQCILVFAA